MKLSLKSIIPILLIFIMPFALTSNCGNNSWQDAICAFSDAAVNADSINTDDGVGVQNALEVRNSISNDVKDMRGLWVASVVNIDYPSEPTTDPEVLKSEAIKILDDAVKAGMNAVFFQVRPTSDALYKSELFPWSKYLTGTQGIAPESGFDPLLFWVEEAHNRGLELHAWINPYRITKKAAGEPIPSISALHAAHPARLNPDWVVKYSDSNLYFNPGIPEVRKLIVDSIMEIVNKYNVDGIHFDDYFYPGRDFADSKTYVRYGKGYKNVGDWRRDNVNILVSEVSKAIDGSDKNIRFGISPFGIWANKSNTPLGSDTRGMESYYDHYADSRRWVKDGIIDYIVPQIYWNIGYTIADYSKLLTWWEDVVSSTGVDLYVGHAVYKACNPNPDSPWYGVAEIERQLLLNQKTPEVKGSVFYNYTSLTDNPGLLAAINAVYGKLDGKASRIPVSISRPSANMKTSYSAYYLNGASDPEKPLYLNGEPIVSRSDKGYFGLLVPLSEGSNIFTLSQEGSHETRVIYKTTGSASPVKMAKAEIPASSVFPQSQEYRMSGEKITLSCQAPAGSKVTVKIGSKTYAMKSQSPSSGSSLYPTRYTYTYTIPSYSGTPRNLDLGTPVYTMNYKGTVKSMKAPAKVGVIMKGSPFYAEVSKEDIDTFETPVSGNGAAFELRKGMVDYVTGMTGSYVRLLSGLWVRKTSVATYTSKARLNTSVKSAVYKTGEKWDTLKLDYPSSFSAIASFDGKKLTLNISSAVSGVLPELPSDSLISSAAFSKKADYGQYTLAIKPEQTIDGYFIEKTASGIILHIKRRPAVESGAALQEAGGILTEAGRALAEKGIKPLSGITIMLDPGHGGSDSGAIGPLGLAYPEKTINLNTALKLRDELEALGAKVLMTRTKDVTLSLTERLDASRKVRPDMFLSIHANSMADNVDISKIDGFSAHYKEALAKPLSEILLKYAAEIGRTKKGVRYNNFYVVRGTWAPSMLIECGFVPNPHEFELLASQEDQRNLAKSLAAGIIEYFAP